jgi:hypothetical protein
MLEEKAGVSNAVLHRVDCEAMVVRSTEEQQHTTHCLTVALDDEAVHMCTVPSCMTRSGLGFSVTQTLADGWSPPRLTGFIRVEYLIYFHVRMV